MAGCCTDQLHLDWFPEALLHSAIETAKPAFDKRTQTSFGRAISTSANMGLPGALKKVFGQGGPDSDQEVDEVQAG